MGRIHGHGGFGVQFSERGHLELAFGDGPTTVLAAGKICVQPLPQHLRRIGGGFSQVTGPPTLNAVDNIAPTRSRANLLFVQFLLYCPGSGGSHGQ